jgi:multicomponent Na+:H+ antiporter subunit E
MPRLSDAGEAPLLVRVSSRILLLVALAVAWLSWSGIYKPLLLGLGAFSCILTYYIARRMALFEAGIYAFRVNLRLLRFWGWLGREIVRSSLDVTRVVLDPRLPISPRTFEFRATASHPVDQAILGNSITLTPGSLTLDLHDGVLRVHSLTRQAAEDLLSGEMDRRVAALRSR